jgi:hypothetical protein
MKRSRNVVLVLSGALATGTFAGCHSSYEAELAEQLNPQGTYTNNYYVSGAGYYHAAYHGWYPYPYNYYDPSRGYYHGGAWSSTPESGAVSASHPSASAVHEASTRASATRSSTVSRGGFGSSSHHVWS